MRLESEKQGPSHIEAAAPEPEIEEAGKENVQVDRHGFALIPQPSQFKDDPLNWPSSLKWLVLLQSAILALLGPFNSSVINPALLPLARNFNISTVEASYQTTTAIVAVGIAPLFWTPLANVWGRRTIYLVSTLIGIAATIGTALSETWAGLLVARVFSGIGTSAPMALGAAVVSDVFFLHERGTKMGVWTVFLTNGAHVAPIIGGYLAQAAGFRWCYHLPAIINAFMFVVITFAFPETLFSRSPRSLATHRERTYTQLLFSFGRNCLRDRHIHLRDFIRPIEMLKYPSVSLTVIYYFVSFAYSTVLPAVTVAILFTKTYHFDTGIIGLTLGLPLLVGSALGEFLSGPFSDWVMYRHAKRHGGERKPEARLPACFASIILSPAGIIIYAVCLQHNTHWIGPVIGMAVTSFGLQLVTTITYTYCSDCYKPQSGEIGTLYNFARQVFSFPLGFYAIPFANRIGLEWAWLTFALITALAFSGIVVLMFKGEEWRKRLGPPKFHEDI